MGGSVIEGEIYDGEYKTCGPESYRLNGGYPFYWVIDKMGNKVEFSRVRFNILFEELREHNLKSILNENQNL